MAARSRVTTILLELLTYSVDEKIGPEVGGVAQGHENEIQKVDSLHIEPQYGIHCPHLSTQHCGRWDHRSQQIRVQVPDVPLNRCLTLGVSSL